MKDATGGVQSMLVLGGTSDIAVATARELVKARTTRVTLAVRDPALVTCADELRALGATTVDTVRFDALDFPSHESFVEEVFDRHGDVDLVLVAFGTLGDQEHLSQDRAAAVALVETNFTGAVSISVPLVQALRKQGHGTLVYLSSVAAERTRKSSFVYGASKAGLDAFAQGLGDALAGSGVRVMVVRPGFVRTKMTRGLKPAPLSTDADTVARAIAAALRSGAETVWVPAQMRLVMSGLRHLPRAVFRRLEI